MTLLSCLEKTTKFLSPLVRKKYALYCREGPDRWRGWRPSDSSIPHPRLYNSELQNIPEEYFNLANFTCKFPNHHQSIATFRFILISVKHQNMPVQDMLDKEKVDKLVEYSTKFPKAVNAADLLENQESGEYTEERSYKYLREELAVRLAHLVMELQHLPQELRLESRMLYIMKKYSLSFAQIVDFEKREADQATLQEFRNLLVELKERHKVC